MWAIVRDITNQKKSENALRLSEERLQKLLNSVTDYIYSVEFIENSKPRTIHREACVHITGYTSKEFTDNPNLWLDIVHIEDHGLVQTFIDQINDHKVQSIEHRIIHKNGDIRWIKNTPVLHFNHLGELVGYDGLLSNITERKEAENALNESEARYRYLFEQNPVPMLIYALDKLDILLVNEAFTNLYGYTLEEATRMTLQDLHPPEEKRQTVDLTRQIKGLSYVRECHHFTKDSKLITIQSHSHGVVYENKMARIASVIDISNLKEAQNALIESEERYRQVTTLSGYLVYDFNPDDNSVKWTGDIFSITGHTQDEYLTANYDTWISMIHPDDKEATLLSFRKSIKENTTYNAEYRFKLKSGEYIWIEAIGFKITKQNNHLK